MIVSLEALGTNAYNRCAMCPTRVRQTPEESRRTYRPKRCGNNSKDEDNSSKTLNDKNHQASSQKFRQLKKAVCICGNTLDKGLNLFTLQLWIDIKADLAL